VAHPVIPAAWRLRSGGLWFEASQGKQFMKPYLQNNQSKMDWSVAQVVERLLCKSVPSCLGHTPFQSQTCISAVDSRGRSQTLRALTVCEQSLAQILVTL
jgi:hypothetical protein